MAPSVVVLPAVLFAAGILCLCGTATAAPGIRSVMGDEVPLAGYSTAGPYVYLYLTGPNLPANGVALHDITKRADQGGFTRVSVDGDNQWSYTWHTNSLHGRLDEGTYTVWVVDVPSDRSRLASADFATIAVTLGKPYVTVDTPVLPGGLDLQSVPDGASLVVNGEYRGKTPLTIRDLAPGLYSINFSRFGFLGLSTQVRVQQGEVAAVNATLQQETGTILVNSTPPGARVLVDGTFTGLSPVVIPGLAAGNHTVLLEMDGYISGSQEIAVPAGRTIPAEIMLDHAPAPATTAAAAGLLPATAGALAVLPLVLASRRYRNR